MDHGLNLWKIAYLWCGIIAPEIYATDKAEKAAFMIARFRANTYREIESCFVRDIMSLAHAQGPSALLSECSTAVKHIAALSLPPNTHFPSLLSTGNVPI